MVNTQPGPWNPNDGISKTEDTFRQFLEGHE